ncbi:MAG: chloride channel protein, partial [Candidatus Thorarchaeota archaeon]
MVDDNLQNSSDAKENDEVESNDLEQTESPLKDDLQGFLINTWKNAKTFIINSWKSLIDDIKHPKKAILELFKSKLFITNALAIVVGIVGAIAAWGFEWLSEGANFVLSGQFFTLMYDSFKSWNFLAIIITPLLAALITAPIIVYFNPESKGSGIPYVMKTIALNDGYMRKRTPFIKLFTSALSYGGGMSVGKEGPITQIGAGLSASIAHFAGLHGRKMRIVAISGLSAAIAATFNSPIGGALFGIEILLVSLVADEIVPVVIASLTSSTISALIDLLKLSPNSSGIPEPSFKVDILRELTWNSFIYDIHWFILLGVLAGLVGVLYTKYFHFNRGIFDRLPIPKVFIPIIGAILTGLIGIASPKDITGLPLIFGGGYSTITNILNISPDLNDQNPFQSLITFLLVLLILKIIITSFSVGSGNPGGIFAPALFIGTCVGGFFAYSVNSIFNLNIDVSVFALAGLASVFAGATRAPLTMIFMGAEMTGNITLIIPLMLTCSTSYLVCRAILKESIYTQPLVDEGLKITSGGNITLLTTTKVIDIMTTNVISIEKGTTMKYVAEEMISDGPFGFPIVDENKKLLGMISVSNIRIAKIQNRLDEVVEKFLVKDIAVLTGEMSVDEALD